MLVDFVCKKFCSDIFVGAAISLVLSAPADGCLIYGDLRDVRYAYDELNRLVEADDSEQEGFDEVFAYDAQGCLLYQRRGGNVGNASGGEYGYYGGTNRLMRVSDGMGGSADRRDMGTDSAFVYDRDGNLVEDRSKNLKIAYDWRGMPVEFVREDRCLDIHEQIVCDSTKLVMAYDGSGRRISKTRLRKETGASEWTKEHVTHYTGIGTEIRENFAGPTPEMKVVVNMPQGLGRYGIEDASQPIDSASKTFEWYLKNYLGSTVAVYRTTGTTAGPPVLQHAYDYRSFGEQVDLMPPAEKVTENFTGKELDDETGLNYFGARYLDPMLGLWTSVDPARQFASPYLYAGNGVNPINGVDADGNVFVDDVGKALYQRAVNNNFWGNKDIQREYEFANTTSTKIFLKIQDEFIGARKLTGTTMDGPRDQINMMHGVSDDYKMIEATVTLSNEGSRIWADVLNTTFDEAEARIAAHEFGAHIRGFSPKTASDKRESIEHEKFQDVDQRLETPKDQCKDYE